MVSPAHPVPILPPEPSEPQVLPLPTKADAPVAPTKRDARSAPIVPGPTREARAFRNHPGLPAPTARIVTPVPPRQWRENVRRAPSNRTAPTLSGGPIRPGQPKPQAILAKARHRPATPAPAVQIGSPIAAKPQADSPAVARNVRTASVANLRPDVRRSHAEGMKVDCPNPGETNLPCLPWDSALAARANPNPGRARAVHASHVGNPNCPLPNPSPWTCSPKPVGSGLPKPCFGINSKNPGTLPLTSPAKSFAECPSGPAGVPGSNQRPIWNVRCPKRWNWQIASPPTPVASPMMTCDGQCPTGFMTKSPPHPVGGEPSRKTPHPCG